MKTPILIIFLLLSLSLKADMDCIWTGSKAGVTIRYVGSCNFTNQAFLDSFLNKVIVLLNRQDTSLKVWVLINEEQLSYEGRNLNYFTSVGYDTLTLMNSDLIFNYYQNKTIASEKINNGFNDYKSKLEPLDINFGIDANKSTNGIKIIYNKYDQFQNSDWTDITKIILYATQNHELIKNNQKRDTVRYNINGWYVSLLTIDTFTINKIIGKQNQIELSATNPENINSFRKYFLWGLLVYFVLGIFAFTYRKHSR